MKVYISKSFSDKLMERTEEQMKLFNDKINDLKSSNKTDIINNRTDVVELDKSKDMVLYAYYIQPSIYVLFAFNGKNDIVLLDELKLINKNKIESLVYGELNSKDEQDDSAS